MILEYCLLLLLIAFPSLSLLGMAAYTNQTIANDLFVPESSILEAAEPTSSAFYLELQVKSFPSNITSSLDQITPCPQDTTSPCTFVLQSLDDALELLANRSFYSIVKPIQPRTLNITIKLDCSKLHEIAHARNITQDISFFNSSLFTITSLSCDRAKVEVHVDRGIEIATEQIQLEKIAIKAQSSLINQLYSFITPHNQSQNLKFVLRDVDFTGFSYKSSLVAVFALEDIHLLLLNSMFFNVNCTNITLFRRVIKDSAEDPSLLFENTSIHDSGFTDSHFLWADEKADNITIISTELNNVFIISTDQKVAHEENCGLFANWWALTIHNFKMISSTVVNSVIFLQIKSVEASEIMSGFALRDTHLENSTFLPSAMLINVQRAKYTAIERFSLIRCNTKNEIVQSQGVETDCQENRIKLQHFLLRNNEIDRFLAIQTRCAFSENFNLTAYNNTIAGNLLAISLGGDHNNSTYILSGIDSQGGTETFGYYINIGFPNKKLVLKNIQVRDVVFSNGGGVFVEGDRFILMNVSLNNVTVGGWTCTFVRSINGLAEFIFQDSMFVNSRTTFHGRLSDTPAGDIKLINLFFSNNEFEEPAFEFKWGTIFCSNITAYGLSPTSYYISDGSWNGKFGTLIYSISPKTVVLQDIKLYGIFVRNTHAILIEGLRPFGVITVPRLAMENIIFDGNHILSEYDKSGLIGCTTYMQALVTAVNVTAINNVIESMIDSVGSSSLISISAGRSSFVGMNLILSNNFGSGISSGLYIQTTFVHIFDSSFSLNGYLKPQFLLNSQSKSWGSPVVLDAVQIIVEHNIFEHNRALQGAGVFVMLSNFYSLRFPPTFSTIMNFTNNKFINNSVSSDGGAIYFGQITRLPTVIIMDNQFIANSAHESGGAIYFDKNYTIPVSTLISQNTFIDNEAWGVGRDLFLTSLPVDSQSGKIEPSFILSKNIHLTTMNYSQQFESSHLCSPSIYISSTGSHVQIVDSTFNFSLVSTITCFQDSSYAAMFITTVSPNETTIERSNFSTSNNKLLSNGKLPGITAIKTQIRFVNSYFADYTTDSPIFQLSESISEIHSTNFNGITIAKGATQEMPIIQVSTNASLLCSYCAFRNIKGPSFQVEQEAQLKLEFTRFENTMSGQKSNIYITSNGVASINHSNFTSVSSEAKGGSIQVSAGSLMVHSSMFHNNSAGYEGGAIHFSQQALSENVLSRLTILNCNFSQNNLTSSEVTTLGGALFFSVAKEALTNSIIIQNNNFSQNYAGNGGGGAAFIKYTQPAFNKSSPIFELIEKIVSENVFENNSALYGSKGATNPFAGVLALINAKNESDVQFTCSVSPCQMPKNITATWFQNFSFNITLIDLYGNKIQADSSHSQDVLRSPYSLTLQISGLSNQSYGSYCKFSSCVVSGHDILLQSTENSRVTLNFTISIVDNPPVVFILETYLRPCLPGEINTGNNEMLYCTACRPGYYSLDTKRSDCEVCPSGANCPGGSQINVLPGYWRLNNTIATVIRCFNPDACSPKIPNTDTQFHFNECDDLHPGYIQQTCESMTDLSQIRERYAKCTSVKLDEIERYCQAVQSGTETGICNEGYSGVLCSECAPGWGKSKLYKCVKCEATAKFFAVMICVALLKIGLVTYFIYRALAETIDDKRKVHSTLLRILISFFQVEGLLFSVQMHWPLYLDGIRTFIISFFTSTVNPGGYSYNCLLNWLHLDADSLSYFEFNVFYVSFAPLLWTVAVGLFLLLKRFILRKKSITLAGAQHTIRMTFYATYYYFWPDMITTAFSTLNSFDVGGGNWRLVADPSIIWLSSRHELTLSLGLATLAISGFGLPVLLLRQMVKQKDKLDDSDFLQKYGFMYRGYKPEYYLWEFSILLRKLALVGTAVYFASSPSRLCITLAVIIGISIILQTKCSPYMSEILNKLEFNALLCLIAITYGCLYHLTLIDEISTMSLILVAVVSTAIFFLPWIMAYKKVFKTMIAPLCRYLKARFEKCGGCLKRIFRFQSETDTKNRNSTEIAIMGLDPHQDIITEMYPVRKIRIICLKS